MGGQNMRLSYRIVLALAAVFVAACDSSTRSPTRPPEPPPEPQPTFSAEIRRTEFGIPHVTAENWGSLGYGTGYAFASGAVGARFDLPCETIAKLKVGDILYDRDGRGEYFQIYSAPIFRGFFFEIVERRGGYQGYGARNAPIRLAAQMRHTQERQKS